MIAEVDELAAKLPWRDNVVEACEPRMPPHQYVLVEELDAPELDACRALEGLIDTHPDVYLAYFRRYEQP